ncbi:MAG: GNAT family N-acetyltransferase [Spirochaetota bacterium]
MYLTTYDDPSAFSQLVTSLLEEREAENNLPLGIVSNARAHEVNNATESDLERPMLAVVHEAAIPTVESVRAVVVRTPPYPVVIGLTPGATEPAVVERALDEVQRRYGNDIAGFNADTRVVEAYVHAWCRRTGAQASEHMKLRVYSCTNPAPPADVPGRARRARPDDRELLNRFVTGFYHDALPDEYDPARVDSYVERMLAADPKEQGIVLWEVDAKVVSNAAYTGATPKGIRINNVYTPPEHRRHGYASACVADLTKRLLEGGREFCFLFTDLKNPTSNKIYQDVGYVPVSDATYWRTSIP